MYKLSRQSLGHINLRGNAGERRFVKCVTAVLGQQLPVAANTISQAMHRVYWLGPDEWQVVTPLDRCDDLLAELARGLHGQHVAVNDVSGGQVTLHLSGPDAMLKLAKGCTLDLHPSVFRPGTCAQSSLAKAGMLLGCINEAPVYEIIVRRSFAEYVLRWLRRT